MATMETPIISWVFDEDRKLGPPDIVLVSNSGKGLEAHRQSLSLASGNGFGGLLSTCPDLHLSPRAELKDSTAVLEIILHVIYDTKTQHPAPLDVLVEAVERLVNYGLDIQHFISPGRFLYNQLLAAAVCQPMEVFQLASLNKLESLAVAVSKFTFSFDPSSIGGAQLGACEASYLYRLLCLHVQRMDALRNILGKAPVPHVQVFPACRNQTRIEAAWFNRGTPFIWTPRPGVLLSSSSTNPFPILFTGNTVDCIRKAFLPLVAQFDCPLCKEKILERLSEMLNEWGQVKVLVTIS